MIEIKSWKERMNRPNQNPDCSPWPLRLSTGFFSPSPTTMMMDRFVCVIYIGIYGIYIGNGMLRSKSNMRWWHTQRQALSSKWSRIFWPPSVVAVLWHYDARPSSKKWIDVLWSKMIINFIVVLRVLLLLLPRPWHLVRHFSGWGKTKEERWMEENRDRVG